MSKPRPVDFVIIGAMKAGTSTVHQWLETQPEIRMLSWKEPSFFSREDRWSKGLEWYQSLYSHEPEGLVGEASTSYTSPRFAERAAERMAQSLPRARLVFLVRHPVERARSHYRHQVQRGRERRPFPKAIADPAMLYIAQSRYWSCLTPYLERFPRSQILVARTEDLDSGSAWTQVLEHLGLPWRESPSLRVNETAAKAQFTPLLRWLWSRRFLRNRRLPAVIRSAGKSMLTSNAGAYRNLLSSSNAPVPDELLKPVWEDARQLGEWVGERLWDPRQS
ncbi:MAG: sulfotransferase [Actinobacteria bacterium]|nr:sulfotransferase [Actinomycetota bacterium]